MQVREIMQPGVRIVSPDAPITEAAMLMRDHDVGALPVWDGEDVVGLITDRDIVVRAVAESQDLSTYTVDDVMTGASTHEFIEAATDPFASNPAYATADEQHFFYDLMPLSEIGDMCTFESDSFIKPAEIGYAVQRVWSNKLAKAGASPCAPLDPTSIYVVDSRVGSGAVISRQTATSVSAPYRTKRDFYRVDGDLYVNLFGHHHIRAGFDHEDDALHYAALLHHIPPADCRKRTQS